ncbi:D-glycerate dehydrogenase [Sporosarcina sp. E16_3]|uniref:2-hydroxyacid dehydrogenase n=1 Tax=Sporosarcina sp. E16_3 TaxID=2789293 RepID=UPI001A929827|nr:D-glycerate dehydrogenase [Sporosarcina sp. E16_3]MBO0602586.1 D-glycerate dehydrogenase [Sporosarcina sp. E16_3]
MEHKVIVYKKIDPQVLDYLRTTCQVVYFEELNEYTYPQFKTHLQDTHALLGSGLKVDNALLAQSPQLKVVSNVSVGYDNLNLSLLTKRNIVATNTPGVLNETVADAMFGLLLSAARRIPELDAYVKRGDWNQQLGEELFGTDVHGKVIGIVGMGGIGKAIAQRARFGFGMEILYHNRNRDVDAESTYDAQYCSLPELLERSDFVCNMVPLIVETKNLFGAAEFKSMKTSAIFVNGSRGAVVDEEALHDALVNKEIAGAGLDVYKQEPIDTSHPLLKLSNIVTTPHIGSGTKETRLKMGMLAAESVLKVFAGETPSNVLNPIEIVK